MGKWSMKSKLITKAINIFSFSVGRMNLDRAYNHNVFFLNPIIFYIAGVKHFWSMRVNQST